MKPFPWNVLNAATPEDNGCCFLMEIQVASPHLASARTKALIQNASASPCIGPEGPDYTIYCLGLVSGLEAL